MRRVLFCVLLTGLVLILMPLVASTNMASPWKPGEPVGEPVGIFRKFAVISETLSFDLRPLAQMQPARVVATYKIRNNGKEAALRLLFLARSLRVESYRLQTDSRVSFNGEVLSSIPVVINTQPKRWKPPSTLPKISSFERGVRGEQERWGRLAIPSGYDAVRFLVDLLPGEYQIQANYAFKPSEYHGNEMFPDYQIGYVLAPARSWGSFEQLSVEVKLPAGWDVATSLPMQRKGDTLLASFKGIPANSLSITTRRTLDVGKSHLLQYIKWFLNAGWLLWGIGCSILLGWSACQLVSRQGRVYEKLFGSIGDRIVRNGCSTAALLFAVTLVHQQWRIQACTPLKPYLSNTWMFINLRMDFYIAFVFAVIGFLVGSMATLVALRLSQR